MLTENNFIILTNQRSGSTWIETSLGNLDSIHTDYEINWSEELLVIKKSNAQFLLKDTSLNYFFKKFNTNKQILGTKFTLAFYRFFPFADYDLFFKKIKNIKVFHLKRNYIDILKSKLIGRVNHSINHQYCNNLRLIDKELINNQEFYLKNRKKNILDSKKNLIPFKNARLYLINLFINDLLIIKAKKNNYYTNINYELIDKQIKRIKEFLNLKEEEKEIYDKLFKFPTIKKNEDTYPDSFEKYEELIKISNRLKLKIDELEKINFNISEIVDFDKSSQTYKINL